MNKTLRWIGALAAVAVLGFAVYGSTRDFRKPSEDTQTPSWLNRSGSLSVWYTDERLTPYITKAAVEFGEQENITVIPVLKPDENFLDECYNASVANENYPDVVIYGSENLEKAYLSGVACEIQDPEMQIGPLNFSEAAVNAVTYDGKKLGYPLSFDTCVIAYNRTYLEQWAKQMALAELTGHPIDMEGGDAEDEESAAETEEVSSEEVDQAQLEELTKFYITRMVPYTLEDLMTISNSYSVPDGVEGIMSWDVSSIMYNYWIVGSAMNVGGPLGDDQAQISVNNEEAVTCLTKYQALHDYFSIESSEITYDSVIKSFIDGKTVFTIGGYDLVQTLADATADGSFEYEYGFSEMPNITSEIPSASLSITTLASVNGFSDQKDLAQKFALYLTRDEAGVFTDLTGLASCSRQFGMNGGADQIYALEYNGSVSLPKMMETENFWMQLETMFARIWEGADVTEELTSLEEDMKYVLNQSL
jgi:maltose-binding protein MalE